MSLIADGVLIATCLTTAIYCLVLSRRLKRLTSTDDGIGQQILRLNKVLEETKAAVADIQVTDQIGFGRTCRARSRRRSAWAANSSVRSRAR